MGDFNIDLLVDNPLSKAWLDLLNLHGLTQIISEPTRVTMNSKILIDHVFVSKIENINSSKVIHCGNSDHFHTGLTYKRNCYSKQHHTYITYRSFKSFDSTSFLTDLDNLPWSILDSYDNVDDLVDTWYRLFHSVVNLHLPLKHVE